MLPSDENSRILRIESKDSEPMLKKRRRSCFWAQRTQWCRLFFWQTDNKLFQKKNDQKTILPYGEKLCGITPLSVQARGHVLASRLLLQILGAVGRENCLYIFGRHL